jgi:hypothetical protein
MPQLNSTPLAYVALLAEAAPGDKLSPPASAAVLMALLGIALLGLFLIVVVLLGGNWVRKQGSHRRGPSVPPDRAPIRPPADQSPGNPAESPAAKPQAGIDTVRDRTPRDETIS